MTTKSLTLSLDEQQSIPLSTVSGTQGYPGMDIRPQVYAVSTPVLLTPQAVRRPSPGLIPKTAFCCTAAIRSISWLASATSLR